MILLKWKFPLLLLILVGLGFSLYRYHNKIVEGLNRRIDLQSSTIKVKDREITNLSGQINNSNQDLTYAAQDICDRNECLFKGPESLVGYAVLKGYYTTVDGVAWGDVPEKCDVLTVTGGSKSLINDFTDWINSGNAVNRLDSKQNLLLNIFLDNLSDQERSKIKKSSPSNPVELRVIRTIPQGRAAGSCSSFVDIITVQ
jgi:hypothetical protein